MDFINIPWPRNSLKKNTFLNQNEQKTIKKNIFLNSEKLQNENIIKIEKLNILKIKMQNENQILYKKEANNFVFNDGNYDAPIMLIGEAPGAEEDIQGKPFIGRSGKLLRFFLKEATITDYYITNIIPWRPPSNRTPTIEEIDIMKPYILEHIEIIKPKIIVTVGTTALRALNISDLITNVQNTLITNKIGKIFPIYHPSYALRINQKKQDLWKSIVHLKTLI